MRKNWEVVVMLILAVLSALSVSNASNASAQSVTEFTPVTVADFFEWGDSGRSVYDFLNTVEGLTCETMNDVDYGKTIDCSTGVMDEESTYYYFYFTDDEELYLVEIYVNYQGEDLTIEELVQSYAEDFASIQTKAYSAGDFYDIYASTADIIGCGVIPDKTYLCLSGEEATEEYYALITLVYADYDYVAYYDSL